ncbi:MAG: helix-turn-helix domain-containing protein, partial [Acidobacteriota bacterium]
SLPPDLFFRLSSVTLKVPQLRERQADIVMLADHFLRKYSGRWARRAPNLGKDCMQALLSYSFPGNVRELEGEIARLVVMCEPAAQISASALNDRIFRTKFESRATDSGPVPMSLAETEKRLIVNVLQHTSDNRTRAAEILGISREGLRAKMQKFGLTPSRPPLDL